MVKFDPLKHLFSKTDLLGRLAKWVMMLTEFDIKFVSQRAIKGQALTDHLVEAPSPFSFPNPESFPDDFILSIEKDETWELFFDGSKCRTGSGAGVVLISPTKKPIPLSYHLNFLCTNNIAEYEALIAGIKAALALNIKHIHIYGDSQLIIRQVTGIYQAKQDKLSQYKDLAISLLQNFDSYTMEPVPRKDNRHADAMACVASLVSLEDPLVDLNFVIHNLTSPAIEDDSSLVTCCDFVDSDEWFSHIVRYLTDGTFPDSVNRNTRARILKLSARYIILSNVLYRRGYDGLLLRCLNKSEIPVALEEVHSGACGGHFGGKSLVHRLLRMGYYWQTMQKDSFSFVKKCHQCQQHNNLIHAPAQELRSQIASWPFSAWGLDLIGKISPPSSQGHTFIITTTDYFTKWVEAIPLRSTTAEVICQFLLENIISRFGIPSTIISDNGTSFKNKDVKKFLEKYHIKHRFSTPYYPQSNGQAESSNKIIEQILRKTVNKHGKDWSN
ncbi:hypothetical protein SUGI_0456280 [Cryptomeria japonica]|nr:hypothetical protein SUGI_0456280 [Cryptomeria japonica]